MDKNWADEINNMQDTSAMLRNATISSDPVFKLASEKYIKDGTSPSICIDRAEAFMEEWNKRYV